MHMHTYVELDEISVLDLQCMTQRPCTMVDTGLLQGLWEVQLSILPYVTSIWLLKHA